MKNKVMKVAVILLLIMTLTLTNFIFVGASLVSYAASTVETNHKNIHFDAYFTNSNNQEISSVDMSKNEETYLVMKVEVENEGYFNGTISIEDSNFTLGNTESSYVNKIEGNTITLNQINAGTIAEVRVKVNLIKDEVFNLDNLTKINTISLNGKYYDSTEKDINIKAKREVELDLIQSYSQDNVENSVEVITNKLTSIDGENKRIIQVLWNMGLKENNYPIKEINANITVPVVENKRAEVVRVVDFNEMTYYDYSYDGSIVTFEFTNNPNEDNNIRWKNEGNEKVVLTFIYDTTEEVEKQELKAEQKVKLYDEKELENTQTILLDNQEKDNVVTITSIPEESSIYKGKLYAGLEKEYIINTDININYAKAITDGITLQETSDQNIISDVYTGINISKTRFDELFGATGEIIIYDQNGQIIGRINNATKADENGNIVVTYSTEATLIKIETSKPITEGKLEIKSYKKLISEDVNSITELTQVGYITEIGYDNNKLGQVESNIDLKETFTQSKFEVDRDTLSTVVGNSVEIKATLLTNNEQYDLYKNPTFRFEFPEQVENIEITDVELLYEEELHITNYSVDGRSIIVTLEGAQTNYKEETIEGATLVVNANVTLNKKSATTDTNITMHYENQNARQYKDNAQSGVETQEIKVIAPKDLTVINSIPTISLETTGQDQSTSVNLITANVPKQLEIHSEIINTTESNMNNVRILGTLLTDNKQNNLEIQVINGIQVLNGANATIYYTQNEDATNDLNDANNEWTTELVQEAKKYLIVAERLDTGASIEVSYLVQVPENLEYNKQAKESYNVTYINEETSVENTMNSSIITLETGVGPKLEAKLSAKINGQEITQNVKNGEVIQYRIEVSNTGSETINNVDIIGQVPEGTTMVVPEENYEYTGTSYYEELPDKEYKANIQSIASGEVRTFTYEVRVNSDTKEGTKLENTLKINYNGATAETTAHTLTTEKGNIRVTVKRVTDRSIDLYTAGVVQYFAIIENISNENQENVKVYTNFSDNLEVQRLTLMTGMGEEDGEIYKIGVNEPQVVDLQNGENEIQEIEDSIASENIEYSDEINIGTLNVGEAKVLSYDMLITKADNNKIDFSVVAQDREKQYSSNILEEEVKEFSISLNMENKSGVQNVKAGDIITYVITAKNEANAPTKDLMIVDNIPSQLTIKRITINGQTYEIPNTNNLEIPVDIVENGEATIEIETVVNYSEGRTESEAITNVATAQIYGKTISTTSEVTNIILANENVNNDDVQGGNGTTTGGQNNVTDNNIATGTSTISGFAWYDENEDGRKDPNEKPLSGIKVKLLNVDTNNIVKDVRGNDLEVTTNENGVYVLDRIGNGRYIAIFEYNEGEYTLTRYKVAGVAESQNSDVIRNDLTINGEQQNVASTDIIQIDNNSVADINIGLALLQNYDLKLDKYVSRIVMQNSKGTTVREFQDSTLAKAEIDAKQINGTTVIIEYQIKVTNVGEVTGYVRKIADYIPSDMTFSSELNKDWYQTGNTIYTSILSNEPIAAGETKTVTLTLVKSMTEDNTGRINNRAEIAEDYNDLGLKDINSTPGNQEPKENDLGSADVILSIRTGGVVYISIAVAILIVLIIIGFVIWKKKNPKKEI